MEIPVIIYLSCLLIAPLSFNGAYSTTISTMFDSSGVPFVNYGDIAGTYIGPQRNPVNIAKYALLFYENYNNTKDKEFLEKFLNNTNWLVSNAISKGNYSLLEYKFPYPPYGMQPPWQSGFAQSKAIDALTKAHEVTGNKTYLDTAKSLLNSFYVEVKDGGVTIKTPDGGWWYEEYADNGTIAKDSRVLNGMIFSLLGINDYYQYTKDPSAKFLFDQGVTALKMSLPKYELVDGEYSTYDILNNSKPASLKYHLAHVSLLGDLYNATGEGIFKAYHDKWQNFEISDDLAKTLNITGRQGENLSGTPLLPPMFPGFGTAN